MGLVGALALKNVDVSIVDVWLHVEMSCCWDSVIGVAAAAIIGAAVYMVVHGLPTRPPLATRRANMA